MESNDILIVGGGPAGLSTALHLVQSAPHLASRILILEKDYYPRSKLCAGGLVKDAEIMLEKLGLDVNEVPHVKAKTIHLDFKGKGLTFTNSNEHALRIIRRDEFDAWLASKARERGIMIKEGIRVQDIQKDGDGLMVHTDGGNFHARIVVGADGSNGITRQCVFPNTPTNKARVLEIITPSTVQSTAQHSDTNAYFDFLPVPQGIAGYIWDFPTQVGGLPMRCWGIYDANLYSRKNRPSIKEMLYAEMKNHGVDLSTIELKGFPIRWFDPFGFFSTMRVLLVGDAVGVDPLLGEGISIALGYGKVAANSITDALKRDDFAFAEYKRRVLVSPLGRALIARWISAYFIYGIRWKWFQILVWRVLKPITVFVAWLFLINWGKRMK